MGSFPEIKRQGLEADHVLRLRKFEIHFHFPILLQGMMLS
jgi:hypothetical protein